MTIQLNLLETDIDEAAVAAAFDIFEVTHQGKLSWCSKFFEPFDAPYICAIMSRGSEKPFYLLAKAGAVDTRQLREHFESLEKRGIAGENLENPEAANTLLPRKVVPSQVPRDILVQLLLNAMVSSDARGVGATCLQNVTGHLYYMSADSDWVKKDKKDNRVYQIVALEVRIEPTMLLAMRVTTFTRADYKYLNFRDDKPVSKYARYAIDYAGPSMRRVAPGEEKSLGEVFIIKQVHKQRNKVPYLDYRCLNAFEGCKLGILHELVERFNRVYSGIASISLAVLPEDLLVVSPYKIDKRDYKEQLRDRPLAIADLVGSNLSKLYSTRVAAAVARELQSEQPKIVDTPIEGCRNIVLVRDAEFYEDNKLEDPYRKAAREGYICQHITTGTLRAQLGDLEKGKEKKRNDLDTIAAKCCMELAIKDDIAHERMELYDWESLGFEQSFIFALPGPETPAEKKNRERGESPLRYSFIEVAPDGKLSFHTALSVGCLVGDEWSELAQELAGFYTPSIEGFIIDGNREINCIEATGAFPVPDLNGLRGLFDEVEWSLPTETILAACEPREAEGELAVALKEISQAVSDREARFTDSHTLNSIVKSIVEEMRDERGAQVATKPVRSHISEYLKQETGKILLSSIPRTKVEETSVFPGLMGMRCFAYHDALFYWLGRFSALDQNGPDRGFAIRKVCNPYGGELFFRELFETLTAPVVRLGNSTVVPLPFKYLKEYMRALELNEEKEEIEKGEEQTQEG